MKYFISIFLALSALQSFAEVVKLPPATINSEVLGGDVILIKMKDYVIIKGRESAALVGELGPEAKKNFTHDLVMTKSPDDLLAIYDPAKNHQMVQTIVARYAEILTRIEAKPSLN